MQDIYNMNIAMEMAVKNYEVCARQSGRTTRMLQDLRDNDHVLILHDGERRAIQTHCREHNIQNVRITRRVEDVRSFVRGKPNIVLSHSVVHALYVQAVEECSAFINEHERKSEEQANNELGEMHRGLH